MKQFVVDIKRKMKSTAILCAICYRPLFTTRIHYENFQNSYEFLGRYGYM
jgi:hypothetical protein